MAKPASASETAARLYPAVATRRDPKRWTSAPAGPIARSPPTGTSMAMSPSCSVAASRSRWTSGPRLNHVLNSNPRMRKSTNTAAVHTGTFGARTAAAGSPAQGAEGEADTTISCFDAT